MSDQHIELSIQEPLGIARPHYPVTMGVPFPEGTLKSEQDLRVEAGGDALPLQTRTMLTWPDGSVKWVLLDFQADLRPGLDNRVRLCYDRGDRPAHSTPVTISEENEEGIICTGDLELTIASSGAFPIRTATLAGRTILPEGALRSDLTVDGTTYILHVNGAPVVEEPGPLRGVLRVEGRAVAEDGSTSFDATARIYVWAGHPTAKIYLTLTHRMPQRRVHLESWGVHLRPRLSETRDGFLVSSCATGHRKAFVDDPIDGGRTLRVGLVDMPFAPWEPSSREMENEETPEQPRRADPQYTILPGEDGEASEQRPGADWHTLMPAAPVLSDGETTVSFWCRRTWHNAPKEAALTRDGIDLHLYPAWAEPLEWYRGVAKTHELILDLRSGLPDRDERLAFTCGFEKEPAPQVATRNWMVDSGVFGPIFRYQPERYRWWEFILRAAINKHTFNVQADPLMGFSILNYGDFWRVGRGGQWYNNEMDKGYGLILQMVRTGYPIVMEHIEPIIHHQVDVDTIHDDEEDWRIGAQRYHFAKHGAMVPPSLCHEWIDGPLFYYLLTGYTRAEEVALVRVEHFIAAIDRGAHRVKTLTRVAGYPLMALSRMYENYREERYLTTCEKILDWLDDWYAEDGGFFYEGFTPPGHAKVGTALSDGILSCALMRHHSVTGSSRSWNTLKRLVDDDTEWTGVFSDEGFTLKTSSPFRNYYEPEPDFFFEALAYITQVTGDPKYAEIGYADMQRIFVQRNMLSSSGADSPPHFYRYWLPFLARADELGILDDPKPF